MSPDDRATLTKILRRVLDGILKRLRSGQL